jgi:Na+-driven multidrug efflux pump
MFLVWFNAEPILLFLDQEPEVAHLAAIYLRWLALGLPGMPEFIRPCDRYFDKNHSLCVQLR